MYGTSVGAVARAALVPALGFGWLRADAGSLRLTRRGFDVYHDLERAVTYQFIEPLWGEMLREHAAEGADVMPSCAPGHGASGNVGSAQGVVRHVGAGEVRAPDVDARLAAAGASWARLETARRGRLWRSASRAMEWTLPDPVGPAASRRSHPSRGV